MPTGASPQRRSASALNLRRQVVEALEGGPEDVQRALDAAHENDRRAFAEDVQALAARLDAIGLAIEPPGPDQASAPVRTALSTIVLDGKVRRLGEVDALLPLSWKIWTVNHLGHGFTRGA